jgi:hypothetical protein
MSTNPAQVEQQAEPARIGRWVIHAIPAGWVWLPGFGIQKNVAGSVPSNIYLREDELAEAESLNDYVRRQMELMTGSLISPRIAGPAPLTFPGATEAALLILKHRAVEAGTVFQVQHYVRGGKWVGIATLTTLESELLTVRAELDRFMKLVGFIFAAEES